MGAHTVAVGGRSPTLHPDSCTVAPPTDTSSCTLSRSPAPLLPIQGTGYRIQLPHSRIDIQDAVC